MLRAERGNKDVVAVEDDVIDRAAEALSNSLWIAPGARRHYFRPWGWHVAGRELHRAADEQFRRPCGESHAASGTENAKHLANGNFGTRSEHVRELADDDFELGVRERKLFDISLVPLDFHLGDARILAR